MSDGACVCGRACDRHLISIASWRFAPAARIAHGAECSRSVVLRSRLRNPHQAQRAVSCKETPMKKMLLAAAALMLVATSPAFADSHSCRFLGHSRGVGATGPGYNPYDDYYAWTPGCYHGHPSPYARYDQNGHLYDENLPDRW